MEVARSQESLWEIAMPSGDKGCAHRAGGEIFNDWSVQGDQSPLMFLRAWMLLHEVLPRPDMSGRSPLRGRAPMQSGRGRGTGPGR